jgi:hypothetical protein
MVSCAIEFPHTERLLIDVWPEGEGDLVEFRLVYRGPLHAASQDNTRTTEKHEIRRYLHRQLKTLWREHPALSNWVKPIPINEVPSWQGRSHADVVSDDYQIGNARFLPLINSRHGLACALDIIFLRRDVPGSAIINGGDIDNRLKVLLDALKVPKNSGKIPRTWSPSEDEKPLYCLMEDDSQITEIKVLSDRLLLPLEDDERKNDVVLIIHVTTKIVNFDKAYIEFY